MNDEVRVEYPCDPALRSVGRVAVIGVLLRLRMPMMAVEQFRTELDAAIGLAAGSDPDPRTTIEVRARWNDAEIAVDITGPASTQHLSRPRLYR
ncbi:MAG: hypothetical protein ACN4GZ_09865 [Acidimicrobiales bacterium]